MGNLKFDKSLKTGESVEELEKQLADLLNAIYYMREFAEPELWNRYNLLFGDLEDLLFEKETKLHSQDLKEENLKNKILTDFNFNNTHKSDIWYDTAVVEDDKDFEEDVLSKLYKDLVKVLHPDVSQNNLNTREFWHQVSDAKSKNDVKRLESFHQILINDGRLSHNKKISKLKSDIEYYRGRIKKLKSQEPFCYETLLNDENWIRNRRNTFLNQILLLDIRISQKQRMVDTLKAKLVN
jgi:hypothetical protein